MHRPFFGFSLFGTLALLAPAALSAQTGVPAQVISADSIPMLYVQGQVQQCGGCNVHDPMSFAPAPVPPPVPMPNGRPGPLTSVVPIPNACGIGGNRAVLRGRVKITPIPLPKEHQ